MKLNRSMPEDRVRVLNNCVSPPNTIIDEYITVDGLSKKIHLSKPYIYELVEGGEIPYIRPFGRKILFSVSEINELLKAKRVSTKAELEKDADNFLAEKRKN